MDVMTEFFEHLIWTDSVTGRRFVKEASLDVVIIGVSLYGMICTFWGS